MTLVIEYRNPTPAAPGYRLDLTGIKVVSFVTDALVLAEKLHAMPAAYDESAAVRPSILDLPAGHAYCVSFPDFLAWLPVRVFACDGDDVVIYTRTSSETERGRLIVWPGRPDRAEPIRLSRRALIERIADVLTSYLDDLASAFAFLEADPLYRDFRRRVASVRDETPASIAAVGARLELAARTSVARRALFHANHRWKELELLAGDPDLWNLWPAGDSAGRSADDLTASAHTASRALERTARVVDELATIAGTGAPGPRPHR
jgi:hypothetical protein